MVEMKKKHDVRDASIPEDWISDHQLKLELGAIRARHCEERKRARYKMPEEISTAAGMIVSLNVAVRPAHFEGLVRKRLGIEEGDMSGNFPKTQKHKNKVNAVKRRLRKELEKATKTSEI